MTATQFLRVQGLPFFAGPQHVAAFFQEYGVEAGHVILGPPSPGHAAWVKFLNAQVADGARRALHHASLQGFMVRLSVCGEAEFQLADETAKLRKQAEQLQRALADAEVKPPPRRPLGGVPVSYGEVVRDVVAKAARRMLSTTWHSHLAVHAPRDALERECVQLRALVGELGSGCPVCRGDPRTYHHQFIREARQRRRHQATQTLTVPGQSGGGAADEERELAAPMGGETSAPALEGWAKEWTPLEMMVEDLAGEVVRLRAGLARQSRHRQTLEGESTHDADPWWATGLTQMDQRERKARRRGQGRGARCADGRAKQGEAKGAGGEMASETEWCAAKLAAMEMEDEEQPVSDDEDAFFEHERLSRFGGGGDGEDFADSQSD